MTNTRSARYPTEGGITVYRASIVADYEHAADELKAALDDQRGVLFSSGVEFPGRYSRWYIGCVKPPLALCLARQLPVFGVCLGLQGIVEYFGGSLATLAMPVHGKSSQIIKAAGAMFAGIELPLTLGRHHTLVTDQVPDCLQVTARTEGGSVMAIDHVYLPVSAVQFHLESILSLAGEKGAKIIGNVMRHVTMRRAA